jgi:hypothetical protein
MCNGNDTNGQDELTRMAARFIAETNAFLDQFWAQPNVRWPMKANGCADLGLRRHNAAAENGGGVLPDVAPPSVLRVVPELVTRIKRLQQSQTPDGANVLIDAGGDSPVYIIFLVVPEEPAVRATEALTRIPSGVQSDDGRPIGTDELPPAPRHTDPPRSRQPAASPAA